MAPDTIENLINTFDMNLEALKSGKNKAEAEVRKNYIDPLFEILGWNVRNTGLHEYEKEVVAEYSVKDALGSKKADYCFRLDGKDMFFAEAKDPYVNIQTNQKAAFQIRSYCWSAKVPLGILTDFEEFAIYDGGYEPKITDSTKTARITYFNYKEYKDRWEEIAGIFSKEAVKSGSLEKYIKKAKRKKGIPVDEAFLKDMEYWREILAVNIALRNPDLSRKEINFAVQRTIDRIVFLRICEDRGTETYGRMKRLSVKKNIYSGLVNLFREADSRYNSGIFCFTKEKDRTEGIDTLTPNLKMDDSVLKTIIERLYYPAPYNFAVMPADILGQIYERFLGKVIEISRERKVSVEEKPEVRKAGGVYYTPTYIVDYIVKNTVDKQIGGKTPAQVAKMKFLDPACGSGSFLIQAYQHLLNWHLAWYSKNDFEKHIKGKRPVLVKNRKGSVRLGIETRKQILLNNIFGVDIDFQAVEVTKLSLVLKVLEGEDDLTMHQLGIFKERALPDLGKNIKCGNSLIGPDYDENIQLNIDDEEEILRVNAFDWNAEFPEIMRNGGFDAVIGNPPWGAYFSEKEKNYLSKKFSTVPKKTKDSYLYFIFASVTLLQQSGYFGFIIPNTWLLINHADKIRKEILTWEVKEIIDYGDGVFSKVTTESSVLILRKIRNEFSKCKAIRVRKGKILVSHLADKRIWLDDQYARIILEVTEQIHKLFKKIYKHSILFEQKCTIIWGIKPYQIGYGKPPQTEEILKKRSYHSSTKSGEEWKPLLVGANINRYQLNFPGNLYIRYGEWLMYPSNEALMLQPKLLMRQTSDILRACYDDKQYYCQNSVFIIHSSEINLKFLLCLLNSKLLHFIYTFNNPQKGKIFAEIKPAVIRQLPVRIINFDDANDKFLHDSLVSLAEQMLSLYKQFHESDLPQQQTAIQRQIEAADLRIDQLVYKLYGLTEEEIEIVEAG